MVFNIHAGIPKYSICDSSDGFDPVNIWMYHREELVELLNYNNNTLIALTTVLHNINVIDEETKNTVMIVANGGGDIFVNAVTNKVTSPNTLHSVLDVMDQQDQLCGLVRRIRRYLGLLQGYHKNSYLSFIILS